MFRVAVIPGMLAVALLSVTVSGILGTALGVIAGTIVIDCASSSRAVTR